MPTVYENWGFHANPFTTSPLEATEQGEKLLVGRSTELTSLMLRLENGPKIPTVEGGIGAGKTSLVNIAAYKLMRAYATQQSKVLFLPCRRAFQLASRDSAEDLTNNVIREVAQTLIEKAEEFQMLGHELKDHRALNKWLNSPTFTSVQGGLQVLVAGISGGKSTSQNTGEGFDRSGFRKLVCDWLEEIFPNRQGGVVCIIDNMELLQESSDAKQAIEFLRDELLTVHGLKWVLCGANGIIQSVVASPRLDGVLFSPLAVGGIPEDLIAEVYRSRVDAFENFTGSGKLPITVAAFEVLYEALNRNLRSLLSKADDYCLHIADLGMFPDSDDEKDSQFFKWFDREAENAAKAVESQLRPRAWQIFDAAIKFGGQFSPSDYEAFGCASPMALRPQVKDLEDAGLLESARDENDQRRRSITITSKGFMVNYHRQKS